MTNSTYYDDSVDTLWLFINHYNPTVMKHQGYLYEIGIELWPPRAPYIRVAVIHHASNWSLETWSNEVYGKVPSTVYNLVERWLRETDGRSLIGVW